MAARLYIPEGRRPISLAEYSASGITLFTKSSSEYFKRIDRLRMAYFSAVGRAFRAAFNAENRKLLAEVDYTETPIAFRDAIEAAVVKFYDTKPTYRQVYAEIWPVFAERVYDALVGSEKTAGRGFETKADPKLRAAWEAAAIEFIETEGGDLITAVAGFSHENVVRIARRLTAMALSENWSINRLKKEVHAELSTMAEYRARRIARTETMRASNLGSRDAALTTGLELQKEWLVGPLGTGDRHATDDYPDLHGQIREMDELYDVGAEQAMYPCDTRLSAGESVNCRCSEGYIPK